MNDDLKQDLLDEIAGYLRSIEEYKNEIDKLENMLADAEADYELLEEIDD